jgi:excisionase family DNA binding protein
MFSPQEFAKRTGLSYTQVLYMCKKNEIEAIRTRGGHYKIPESQIAKFKAPQEFITREQYEETVRENERLKTIINEFIKSLKNLEV